MEEMKGKRRGKCVARLRANQIIKNANLTFDSPLRVKICRTCKRGYIGRFNPGGRCQCFCVLAAAHMGQLQGKKKVGAERKRLGEMHLQCMLIFSRVRYMRCIKSWRLLYCKLTSEQPLFWITFGSFGDLSLSGAFFSDSEAFRLLLSVPTYAFNKWKSRD